MTDFVEVATTADVPLGRVIARSVGELSVAIYHTAEGIFATDNTCPHRGGPLAQGDLIGNEINCPWHLWGFDVTTGLCAGNREIAVVTHEVRIDGERILVKL